MTKFLLAVHVLAAIVAVGPVTVAASMFPPAARRALDPPPGGPRAADAVATVELLHRICRVYAVVGVVVPVFGFATAKNMGVLGDAWLIASIVLTALAAAVLVVLVLPRQEAVVRGLLPEAAVDGPAAAASGETDGGAGAAEADKASRTHGATTADGAAGVTGTDAADRATRAAGVTGVAGVAVTAATVPGTVTVTRRHTVRLAMSTGVFNLLWAAVTVLMIVRPGSTTGA
ncbi:protease [Streptomyces naganishii]|uniref:Integral membrane protein n=1 Tax=Streptomyces naganishii JCM 4654 TaxID=1306179 RepID=A0A919CVM5_9ACTN|nr:protease [Streptomyces naganishii]GHD89386.1 hypothetical protein GCM10010508_30170 [Streptomyces naganishii JCM 4654]